MQKRILATAIICFAFVLSSASAQNNDFLYPYQSIQYGFFGNFGVVSHDVEFPYFPGYPSCCPKYSNGDGTAYTIGGFGEIPLLGGLFGGLRLGFDYTASRFKANETSKVITDRGVVDAMIEHSIKLHTISFTTDLYAGLHLYKGLTVFGGLRFGAFAYNRFNQREDLLSPAGFVFPETGTRTRNESNSKKLENTVPVRMWSIGGLQYEFAMNEKKTLRLAPEISFAYSLNPMIKDTTWNSFEIRFGAALKFSPPRRYDISASIACIDTITVHEYPFCDSRKAQIYEFEPETLSVFPTVNSGAGLRSWRLTFTSADKAELSSFEGKDDVAQVFAFNPAKGAHSDRVHCSLVARDVEGKAAKADKDVFFRRIRHEWGVDISYQPLTPSGKKYIRDTLVVEKMISTNMRPLLNYVFFDEGRAEIPARYTRLNQSEKSKFRYDLLHNQNSLETYYQVMNIYGKLAEENPDFALSIVGCHSGDPDDLENDSIALARAQSVADYLTGVWKVPAERLLVSVSANRGLPESPTKAGYDEDLNYAREENRRVEINIDSTYFQRISPISTVDTILSYSYSRLTFYPKVLGGIPVKNYSLKLYRRDEIMGRAEGETAPPKEIVLNMNMLSSELYRDPVNLKYEFRVRSTKGQECRVGGEIPVVIAMKDSTIEKASLILFEFNKHELKYSNRRIIDLVQKQIKNGAHVTISGYADVIGDSAFNRKLSVQRAINTAGQLFEQDFSEGDEKYLEDYETNEFIQKRPISFENSSGERKSIYLTLRGMGEKMPLIYPNDIPEGRFYCRTVTIEIKNPVK